jgi:hypothetical protein
MLLEHALRYRFNLTVKNSALVDAVGKDNEIV